MVKKSPKKKTDSQEKIARRKFLQKSGRTTLIIGGIAITGGAIITGIHACGGDDTTGPNTY